MAGFALADSLVKALSATLPAGEVAMALGIGGTLVFGAWAWLRGVRLLVVEAISGAALLRNMAECVAAMCMILSIALVPLSVVSAILQAMPLAVTLAAALFLGEPVGVRRWGAIALGFVGVLMILRPGTAGFDLRVVLPLFAVLALTVRDIATKRVPDTVSSLQLSGWGFMAVVPAGIFLLLLRSEAPEMPNLPEFGLMLLMVLFGILGYGALVLATRAGSIALTTPFRYSRLIFAMMIGVIWFDERPDAWTLAGSALVVVAGLYALMREMRLKRRKLAK